ncbi:hypothetical protein DI09_230p10, partial [Mitosporidium daphniae]
MPSDEEGRSSSPNALFKEPLKKRLSSDDIDMNDEKVASSSFQSQMIHLPLKKQYMQEHHLSSPISQSIAKLPSSPIRAAPLTIDIDDSVNMALDIDAPIETPAIKETPPIKEAPSTHTKTQVQKGKAQQHTKASSSASSVKHQHPEEVHHHFYVKDLENFPYHDEVESYRKRALWLQYSCYKQKYSEIYGQYGELRDKYSLVCSLLRQCINDSESLSEALQEKVDQVLSPASSWLTCIKDPTNSFLLEKVV